MARRSSLEAGAWGIAYPDFLRLCFAPLISPNADRGTAVEEAWRRNLRRCQPPRDDWRLMELSDPIRRGRMPPVVFNATIAETGQRLLISPILNEPMTREQFVRGAFLNPPGAVEFMRLFDNAESDLRVSTAVRLSAAFPFVSPIARARRENTRPSSERWAALKPKVRAFFNEFNDWERTEGRREFLKNCHVVDGGYVDNEGAFTAIQWVNSLLKYYSDESTAKSRPFDRIVFLRIMPFPPEQARGTDSQDWSPDKEGWANEFTGPLSALASVRTTSQLDRNSFSLGVLESSANKTETTRIGERVQQISKELGDRARVPSSPASRGNPLPQPIQERLENEVWAAARAGDARPASLPPITVERIQFVFQLFDGDRPIAQHITPLSWKLTAQEKKDIDAAWEAISRHHEQDHRPLDEKKQTDPLAVLDEYFILRRK
jgi:hypothetical protein